MKIIWFLKKYIFSGSEIRFYKAFEILNMIIDVFSTFYHDNIIKIFLSMSYTPEQTGNKISY